MHMTIIEIKTLMESHKGLEAFPLHLNEENSWEHPIIALDPFYFFAYSARCQEEWLQKNLAHLRDKSGTILKILKILKILLTW